MSLAEVQPATAPLIERAHEVARAAKTLIDAGKAVVRARVLEGERISSAKLEAEQRATHALAWAATYQMCIEQLAGWAERVDAEDRFGEAEFLVLSIGVGEYANQLAGGIPMSQTEMARPSDFGASPADVADFLSNPAVATAIAEGNTAAHRKALIPHIERGHGLPVASGLDETMEAFREEMRRFAESEVLPHAHEWHLANAYIPMEIIEKLAELGVFGLTIPEEYGGLGLGKESMCVVSEELSRGYIGVGSLGTRSEIAAELILGGGTEAQKAEWLPKIASAEVLPTAVFTEPDTGSDLGSLRSRAARDGEDYVVTGNKTWITHAARADVMTMLVRTDPATSDHTGLSMLIAPKPRGSEAEPFPAPGMTGGEIEVLGYRGMKEYELGFDGFRVPAANLLGGIEGQGFRQLMRTFESARIQTAARAIGVAQSALELALAYARDRKQFGKALIAFPRVHGKLAMMAVEIMIARQLTYHAAREKDGGRRCDLEAGMAKLLAARVAWAAADNGLQIHGGNGFALEYPISRVLCDARILSIFEGAAEIQAQVIARRLLESPDA